MELFELLELDGGRRCRLRVGLLGTGLPDQGLTLLRALAVEDHLDLARALRAVAAIHQAGVVALPADAAVQLTDALARRELSHLRQWNLQDGYSNLLVSQAAK